MKKEILIERAFQAWAVGLGIVAVVGVAFAIVQAASGNVHATAAFEF